MKDIKVQDAIARSWVDIYAPVAIRPYMRLSRLDRPVGAWLLFLPCVFGAVLAAISVGAGIWTLSHVIIVCAIGSWLMRGAGCTWNDIVDRKIDAQVERTKSRPLPSGQVTVKQALTWMIAQMTIAAIGLLTFEWPVILLTMGSLVIVAAYPFAKRFTNWPQLVLGLCFNWGVLVAWMQITGAVSWAAISFYIAMIFWTLFYDTIYAYQDVEDDALIGVKSSARALGDNPMKGLTIMLAGTSVFAAVSLSAVLSYNAHGFVLWGFLGLAVFLIQLFIQRFQLDHRDGSMCLKLFRQNVRAGQVLAVIWLVGYLFN